ncbi:calcium-binding protein [Derxia lacustris]|uniref:calcium-binding protein n=1 Tax=Derxia lacustris TaxID=764842 RepID=UPI000A171DE7|nr:calcium-binding protein [Derxia lacustris]
MARIVGSSGNDTLNGSDGDDSIDGGAGNDRISGRYGADWIVGGPGDDWIYGGKFGGDTVDSSAAPGAVVINLLAGRSSGADGHDTLIDIENAVGSAFADRLVGSDGNNLLAGGAGHDTLLGGAGHDTLRGGPGNDSLDGGGNELNLGYNPPGTGGDWLDLGDATAAVVVNLASGRAIGGAGNDSFSAIENVSGSAFADRLTGDAGANYLHGGAGADTLEGGAGSDVLSGGLGDDLLVCHDGLDWASYAFAGGAVVIALASGSASGADGNDRLIGFDNALGSAFADSITGDGNANLLDGGAGNDTLGGGRGDDSLRGGAGDDRLLGGTGNDWALFDDGFLNVVASLATGLASGYAIGNDTLVSIENLRGGDYNDRLTGDAGANILVGGGGYDTLEGGAGDDTLDGGDFPDMLDGGAGSDSVSYAARSGAVQVVLGLKYANDNYGARLDTLISIENAAGSGFDDRLLGSSAANRLDGAAGNDTLDGRDGDDTLGGGAGDDSLIGGSGADRFVFDSPTGSDRVADFASGSDRLVFDASAWGLGNGDATVDGAVAVAGPGGFAASAELVLVTADLAGSIASASAAATAIGSASGAYAVGAARLFVLDDGAQTAVWAFHAADGDAAVSAGELALVTLLLNTGSTALGDYQFI